MSASILLVGLSLLAAQGESRPKIAIVCVERGEDGLVFRDALAKEVSLDLARRGAVSVRIQRKKLAPSEIFDVSKLLRLARRSQANIAVAASLQRSSSKGASGITTRGFGRLVALDVNTGKKLGEFASNQSAQGQTERRARMQLYEAWTEDVTELVASRVIPAWSRQLMRGTPYRVVLAQASQPVKTTFVKTLKTLNRVVSVRLLADIDDRMTIEVHYRGSAEQLVSSVFQQSRRKKRLRRLTRVGRGSEPIALELAKQGSTF